MKLHEARKLYIEKKGDIFEETCPSIDSLVDFIKEETKYFDYHECNYHNFNVVVGLSGGIDSAVIAALAVKALGPEKVHGVMMPSSTNENIDLEYAEKHAKQLGIKYDVVPIGKIEDVFNSTEGYFETANQKGNMKARTRMIILYDKARKLDGLFLGTSNMSEFMTGYFTKFGDGAADIETIVQLYKTHVRQIAKKLDVPEEIITRKPTAGLWKGQTDEGELGIDYVTLDKILMGKELGFDCYDISKYTGIHDKTVSNVLKMIEKSRHKRKPAPEPKSKFIDIVAETQDLNRENYMLGDYDRILDELTSKEKCKQHILNIYDDNAWNWYCFKGGYPSEEFGNIYYWLLEFEQKFPKDLEPYVTNFEDAVIEIIADKELFFKKVKYGSEHTISEYVGTILSSSISDDIMTGKKRSRSIKSGRFAKKLSETIKLDDIIAGTIEKGSEEFSHQLHLLNCLHRVKTFNEPGLEFWQKAEKIGFKPSKSTGEVFLEALMDSGELGFKDGKIVKMGKYNLDVDKGEKNG